MKKVSKIVIRIVRILILLFGITFLSFALSFLAPGDPAEIMLNRSGRHVDAETLNEVREEMGLNDPVGVQYLRWVGDVVHGDLGVSYKSNKPVSSILLSAVPNTLILTLVSMAVMILTATPLGVLCALFKDSPLDRIVRGFTYLFSSLPSFFVALVLLYVLALKLGIFNVVNNDFPAGLVMPVATLVLTLGAWYVRQVRSLILGQMDKDYVTGLITKGYSDKRIFFGHILKNCLAPLITLFSMSFGSMLGGSAIVESIFVYNGVGKLAIDSISARDYPVIQGYVIWMAVIFLIVNAAADIICRVVDPRIRREFVS